MKLIVSDMPKYSCLLAVLFAVSTQISWSQHSVEREHRIRKSQFPAIARLFISQKLENARKFKYYKEIDSSGIYFISKFKKDRLRYNIGFDGKGNPLEIAIVVGKVDIPGDALANIEEYLRTSFQKYRIRKILQKYALDGDKHLDTSLRNAFQNLLIPDLVYEILAAGKKGKSLVEYDILFDSEGNLLHVSASLPANYDHVLY